MKENKDKIDLSKLSSQEELSKVAKICDKLNYLFDKKRKNTQEKEESTLEESEKQQKKL